MSFQIHRWDCKKFYPEHHFWGYCVYLGRFVDSKGVKYDLGVFENDHDRTVSFAIVYQERPYEFKEVRGLIEGFYGDHFELEYCEAQIETVLRYEEYQYYKWESIEERDWL